MRLPGRPSSNAGTTASSFRPRAAGKARRFRPAAGRSPSGVPVGTTEGPRWELVVDSRTVAVRSDAGTVAEAHIWERDGRVFLEFWIDGADVPAALGVDLVDRAFAHPAVPVHAEVLACLPRRDVGLLDETCRHIENASTRTTGMTHLVEGRVRGGALRAS